MHGKQVVVGLCIYIYTKNNQRQTSPQIVAASTQQQNKQKRDKNKDTKEKHKTYER